MFERIAAMGFSHVCLAPPFEPGATGDIFYHFSFDRLHPALGFSGAADDGIALIAQFASSSGMGLMLDIAPGQVAIDAAMTRSQPHLFKSDGGDAIAIADPWRERPRLERAIPQCYLPELLEAYSGWWVSILERLTTVGVGGFRCLTLDQVPDRFWRRLITAFPESLFLAWTASISELRHFNTVGFTLTCFPGAWWDGRSLRIFDKHAPLREIAPAMASPEPSFSERLAHQLPPGADLVASYRFALHLAVCTGAGLFLPSGFEFATSRRFDTIRADPTDMAAVQQECLEDLSLDVAAAIRIGNDLPEFSALNPFTTPESPVTALLRKSTVVVINPDLGQSVTVELPLRPLPPSSRLSLSADSDIQTSLKPGELRILRCSPRAEIHVESFGLTQGLAESTRVIVEVVEPSGELGTKTVSGREVMIRADVYSDGHEMLAAELIWRAEDCAEWERVPMVQLANDRWEACIRPSRIGLHCYAVEAWRDQWGSFTRDLLAKLSADQDVSLEIQEGYRLIVASGIRSDTSLTPEELLSEGLRALMRKADRRPFATRTPVRSIWVDRPLAEFASWYELFPRSATNDRTAHGTFRSVTERLPDIQRMGFDVLYFPPIHPIGRTNRKGRNNSLIANVSDVGSPYAVGSAEGGHDSTHPALGTLADFRQLLESAQAHHLEIAIDFAIQCAPDHPWVTQYEEWFTWRPDGSMRYAENPPKKYEDIVNPDFYGEKSLPRLWIALRDVIQFWVDQGVTIFRVDNPHTKPLPFWQWMIADIQGRHPHVLFLSEAFTRPKLMYQLAKVGFSQSYTYFTWRNTKREITEYLTEVTRPPVAEFFRPNFFVNTPDINPIFLQTSGRAGFLIRAALAATLSGLWGIYSGFEICEADPLPGREEYLDSEKYEIRPRNYAAQGNIVAEIGILNHIRRRHPALQSHLGLKFYNADSDNVILYGKRDPMDRSIVLVAVTLDPHAIQEVEIEIPLWEFGLEDKASIMATDLIHGDTFGWYGKNQRIRLDPADLPYRIWRLEAR
jgi:starch synthase (maltosyl-transferring)